MDINQSKDASRNLASSIIHDARIPDRVFSPDYGYVYVVSFQRLMSIDALDLIHALMREEGASHVMLSTLTFVDKSERPDERLVVSESTSSNDYREYLKHDTTFGSHLTPSNTSKPWFVFADRVACCSNVGGWCIYGQRFAEIALIAFKVKPNVFAERNLLKRFGVECLADAMNRNTFFGGASNEFSASQRARLAKSYL
jgi:hypothetical protein